MMHSCRKGHCLAPFWTQKAVCMSNGRRSGRMASYISTVLRNTYMHSSTSVEPTRQPEHVVVLGAGITGLTTAFYLKRRFPNTRITVLESSPRVGGWIQSERVDLGTQYGQVVLESGPRTLRPVSKPLLELINLLDLNSRLVLTPKSSPAAKNRFLYMSPPDGNGLKALPSSPIDLFISPFFFTLVSSVLTERYWPPNRTQPVPVSEEQKVSLLSQMKVYDDESVDAFLTRRFGAKVARLFGSSLVHGIYAADSRRLSLRAAFPSLWEAEDLGRGSVISGILRKKGSTAHPEAFDTGKIQDVVADASVFSFQHGMSELSSALMKSLSSASSVDVRLSCAATSIIPRGEDVEIALQDGSIINASNVISTIPLPELQATLVAAPAVPHLGFNPASTVIVVNLVFPCPPHHLHPAGFGYLIPRPIDGYGSARNDMIGVVFDSCALSAQDIPGVSPVTKLTIMCGGPYETTESGSDLNSLLSRLFQHLARPRLEPVHVKVQRQVNCIPTPLVGHLERVSEMKRVLLSEPWNGRLHITGAGVDGAGIADCIQAARKAALTL